VFKLKVHVKVTCVWRRPPGGKKKEEGGGVRRRRRRRKRKEGEGGRRGGSPGSDSQSVGDPGSIDEPDCRREKTFGVAGGLCPDGPQPPSRGEGLEQGVSRVGAVSDNVSGPLK